MAIIIEITADDAVRDVDSMSRAFYELFDVGENIGKWAVSPVEFYKDIDDELNDLVADMANRVFNGVVRRSPVRTGQFRRSWQAKKNRISRDTVDSGGAPGSPLSPPRLSPVKKTRGVTSSGKLTYFVTNFKPYAVRLENGWSKQAPSGMVRETLASL